MIFCLVNAIVWLALTLCAVFYGLDCKFYLGVSTAFLIAMQIIKTIEDTK